MKQFFKMFFASFLAMVVTGFIIFAVIIGIIAGIAESASSEEETDVASNSVLLIDTENVIHEQGVSNSFAAFSGDDAYSPGLYDITRAIEHAKTDDKIKGILLKLGNSPNGWATMQQLRHSLKGFKSTDKFIYAYGEMIPQTSLYLASIADSVFLNPVGYAELKGLSSTLPFFKGTLNKLEVEPLIFYAGKFKSATEPFREEKISEPNRQQIAALQNDLWADYTAAVASHSGTTPAAIHQLAVNGSITFPADALNHRLVDRLLFWDEVEQRMRAKTDRKEDEKIKYVELTDYAAKVKRDRKLKDERIAVLFAEGNITDGERNTDYEIASKDFVDEIRKIKKNDKIKAVVLRINSPGGSALASEVILRELNLLKAKKPVIVSMGDVAASGGYYIACQADSIFAQPNTITGSIGVFTMLFNTEALLKNKLGITFDEVKNAPSADFPTATRSLTAQESQRMQASVDTIYSIFKRRVADGRKMDVAVVDSFAQGRVWSGTTAMKIGLVDGLGGLDRALYSAAKKAGLSSYQVVTYPEPIDKFQSLMRQFKGVSVASDAVKAAMAEQIGRDFDYIQQIRSFYNMNGRAQMAMPFQVTIR